MARTKATSDESPQPPLLTISYERSGNSIKQNIATDDQSFSSEIISEEGSVDGEASADWWKSYIAGNWPTSHSPAGNIEILDLFSGAGGLSIGVKLAAASLGIEATTYAAVDVDEAALRAYKLNQDPVEVIHDSVRNLVSYSVVKEEQGFRFGSSPTLRHEGILRNAANISVVVGGPPCQGHSTFNNKSRQKDVRNELYLAVPAMAVAIDADVVIIENVPNVRAASENVVGASIDLLTSAGYCITEGVISADTIGWPQTRSRYFIVATKKWEPINLRVIERSLSTKTRDLRWLMGDLEDVNDGSIMTANSVLSEDNQERIKVMHEQGLYEIPDSVRPQAHIDSPSYKSVYGRLHWEKPAQTITTGFLTPGRGRYVHPSRERTINAREAARIQGFPDTYRFENGELNTTRAMLTKWIGDAVPSPLGFAAGLSALINSKQKI